jgi:hypothetical protein
VAASRAVQGVVPESYTPAAHSESVTLMLKSRLTGGASGAADEPKAKSPLHPRVRRLRAGAIRLAVAPTVHGPSSDRQASSTAESTLRDETRGP